MASLGVLGILSVLGVLSVLRVISVLGFSAEMFKSRISRPNRTRFLKNLVLQALGTIRFRFLHKKSKKKFSCLCTFKQ